jgi:hypothetical protein
MSHLSDYANRLAQLYVRRKDLQIGVSHNETDIEARKSVMVPASGWLADQPKSTVDQRKAAADQAYANDEILQKMRALLSKLRDEATMLEGEIEAQEILFRAARYQIKQDLNDILRRKYLDVNPDGEPGAEAEDAHDSVGEAEAEALAQAEAEDVDF